MYPLARGATLPYIVAAAHLLLRAAAACSTSNCQPGQPCWPTVLEWQTFNQSISGRLGITVPLASVCYPNSPNYNSEACDNVKANYHSGVFREGNFGAQEITQWEVCGAESCYPGLYGPMTQTCSLGRLPALYVNVETPEDIAATLAFAKEHGVRIVVKNTGHDYLGRSAAANTLGLFTSKMKNMSFHPSFTLDNCPAAGTRQNIAVVGAGVTADEAVEFFAKSGMMVATGGCGSVGIAGGFGQGGGHGPLSSVHGLLVDQAVEFDVITSDGVFRTINECNDPDLFWAMRGGGGQSYAILVNYKFQAHPQTTWATWRLDVGVESSDLDVTKNNALRGVLSKLAGEQPNWSRNHISGYDILSPTTVSFLEILPIGGDDPLGTLKSLTFKFETFVNSHPDISVTLNQYSVFENKASFYAEHAEFLNRIGLVGVSVLPVSRLVTTKHFETPDNVDVLVGSILQGMEVARQQMGGDSGPNVSFFILKTAPVNTPDADRQTSANPAWRDALWHLVTAGAWLPGTPDSASTQIAAAARAAMDQIKERLSVQAAYINESDVDEPDWEHVFFGDNYDRLLAIKERYDPEYVLNCKKCVGYLGDENPMYSCYGENAVGSVPFSLQ